MCAFVQVCMCDWEYFMVKQRVNSDRRQMWSHPSKAARIKNYSNKTSGSGQSSTFLKMTYFRVVLKRSQRKPVNGTGAPHPPTHPNSMVLLDGNIWLHKAKPNLRILHTIFLIPADYRSSEEVSHSFKHHKTYKT